MDKATGSAKREAGKRSLNTICLVFKQSLYCKRFKTLPTKLTRERGNLSEEFNCIINLNAEQFGPIKCRKTPYNHWFNISFTSNSFSMSSLGYDPPVWRSFCRFKTSLNIADGHSCESECWHFWIIGDIFDHVSPQSLFIQIWFLKLRERGKKLTLSCVGFKLGSGNIKAVAFAGSFSVT